MVLRLFQAHGCGAFLILNQWPFKAESILLHSDPILMHMFIPRIIFAGLASAESPRPSHRFYLLLVHIKKDTSCAVQNIIPALAPLFLCYFGPVIRSRAEAGGKC